MKPSLTISGTSGQKFPKRRISAHFHAYRRRRASILRAASEKPEEETRTAGGLPSRLRALVTTYWKIPLSSVLAFEERRGESDRLTAEWSRDLDAIGAPAE